jgi:putative protease
MRGKGEADVWSRLELFAELKVDAVGIPNPGTLAMALEYSGIPIYADTPFNVFNSESVDFLRAYGLAGAVLSPELTLQQVERISARTDFPLEVLVHGQIPLMVSEFCLGGGYLGDVNDDGCSGVCHEQELFLRDRMGERFPVKTDDSCRMHVLNAKNLSMLPFVGKLLPLGLDRIRIDAVHMSPDDVGHVVAAYRKAIDTGRDGNDDMDGNTRGHYFRGVL